MGLILEPLLKILKAIPIWVYAIAILLAYGGYQRHRAITSTKAAAEATAAEAMQRQEREAEFKLSTVARESADAYAKNLAAVESSRDRTGAELERLRRTIASNRAVGASAAATGKPDGAATAERVVEECAGTLEEVAADAERSAAKVIGLQAYIRNVLKECRK